MLKASFNHLAWIKILDANIFFRPKNQLGRVKLSLIITCFLLYNVMKFASVCVSVEKNKN